MELYSHVNQYANIQPNIGIKIFYQIDLNGYFFNFKILRYP